MRNVLAVILGGGRGTRLFPLTKYRSKPAVPIGGNFRLIDIPISNCLHWGVKKIFVLTQFNTASLHRHITSTYKFDGFSRGFVQILAAQQTLENNDWYEGTADAVRKNIHYIKNQDVACVAILSGDQLFRIDLGDLLKYHRETGADITIATKPIERSQAGSFGIMKIDRHRQIREFAEKPKDGALMDRLKMPAGSFEGSDGDSYLASMGIYIFSKDVLVDLLEGSSYEDFGKQIIPEAIRTHKVFSYIFNDYWEDIGTIDAFFHANLDFASTVPKFNFYDELNPIFTHPRFLPGSRIKDCKINHALISEGSTLEGSTVIDSVIGIRSVIQEGSDLEKVVMMGADYFGYGKRTGERGPGIGKNCYIRRAIIDKNVHIGNNVRIDHKGNLKNEDRGIYHIVDGIVVIPKNGYIPNNTIID